MKMYNKSGKPVTVSADQVDILLKAGWTHTPVSEKPEGGKGEGGESGKKEEGGEGKKDETPVVDKKVTAPAKKS